MRSCLVDRRSRCVFALCRDLMMTRPRATGFVQRTSGSIKLMKLSALCLRQRRARGYAVRTRGWARGHAGRAAGGGFVRVQEGVK